MFNYNKKIYGIGGLVTSFLVFYIIYILRYNCNIIISADYRRISDIDFIMFLFYSVSISVFNVSMKIYEFSKIHSIKNSLFSHYLASMFTALIFSFLFYLLKIDYARFVFFSGLLISPLILSVQNKFLFKILFPRSKEYSIYFIGEDKTFTYVKKIVSEYNDIINFKLSDMRKSSVIDSIKNCIILVDHYNVIEETASQTISKYELKGYAVYTVADLFDYLDESIPSDLILNNPLSEFSTYKLNSFYMRYLKRMGDFILSLILIIITSPLMIITAVLIKSSSKGSILYIQKRMGLNGNEFDIFKFRTMYTCDETESCGFTAKNDFRITAAGKILRPFHIDELPQLFNILLGQMSFIGPRPERKEIFDEIIKLYPLFYKRLLVKPGLTGWAQVKHRYVDCIEEMNKKLDYDLYYIKNSSMIFDLKIILYTIETIIFKRGSL